MLFAPLVFLSTGQVVAQSRKEEKDKNIKHATLRAYFHFLDKDCPLSERFSSPQQIARSCVQHAVNLFRARSKPSVKPQTIAQLRYLERHLVEIRWLRSFG